MGRREGVVDITVEVRCEPSYQVCPAHLPGFELHTVFERGGLLGKVAEVVKQQDLAVFKALDPFEGGRTGDVLDETDLFTNRF